MLIYHLKAYLALETEETSLESRHKTKCLSFPILYVTEELLKHVNLVGLKEANNLSYRSLESYRTLASNIVTMNSVNKGHYVVKEISSFSTSSFTYLPRYICSEVADKVLTPLGACEF